MRKKTEERSENKIKKLRWYKTIQFKLLLFFFTIISATIGGMSYQNIKSVFQDMELQVQYELSNDANRMSNSIAGLLEVWASSAFVLMNSIDKTTPQILQDQMSAVLRSNKDIIAVKFVKYVKSKGETLLSFQFTPHLDSFHFGADKSGSTNLKRVLSAVGQNQFVRSNNDGLSGKSFLEPLAAQLGQPIVSLRTPFKFKGSDARHEAILYLWTDRLTAAMSKGPTSFGMLLGRSGQVLAESLTVQSDLSIGLKSILAQDSGNGVEKIEYEQVAQSQKLANTKVYAASKVQGYDAEVKLVQDVTQAAEFQKNRVLKLAAFAWIIVILCTGGVYFGVKGTVNSILDAEIAAKKIAKGDFTARVTIKSQDEMGLLGSAINQMAEQIGELFAVKQVAVRQEQELKMAQAVQLTLLPRSVQKGALLAKGFYRSASECAGDYWNVLKLGPSKTLVVIADVVGHGAHSALIVAVAHGFFEHYAQGVRENSASEVPLNKLFTQLNDILWAAGEGKNSMTMFGTLFDADTETLISCGAGHVFPFHLRPNKSSSEFSGQDATTNVTSIVVPGNLIGSDPFPKYELKTEKFEDGDRLVLFTDGLFECRNADGKSIPKAKFRKQVSLEIAYPLEVSFSRIVDFIHRYFGDLALDDDITFVMVEYHKESNPALGQETFALFEISENTVSGTAA